MSQSFKLYLDSEMHKRIKLRAHEKFGDNQAAYVRSLVIKDNPDLSNKAYRDQIHYHGPIYDLLTGPFVANYNSNFCEYCKKGIIENQEIYKVTVPEDKRNINHYVHASCYNELIKVKP